MRSCMLLLLSWWLRICLVITTLAESCLRWTYSPLHLASSRNWLSLSRVSLGFFSLRTWSSRCTNGWRVPITRTKLSDKYGMRLLRARRFGSLSLAETWQAAAADPKRRLALLFRVPPSADLGTVCLQCPPATTGKNPAAWLGKFGEGVRRRNKYKCFFAIKKYIPRNGWALGTKSRKGGTFVESNLLGRRQPLRGAGKNHSKSNSTLTTAASKIS